MVESELVPHFIAKYICFINFNHLAKSGDATCRTDEQCKTDGKCVHGRCKCQKGLEWRKDGCVGEKSLFLSDSFVLK